MEIYNELIGEFHSHGLMFGNQTFYGWYWDANWC